MPLNQFTSSLLKLLNQYPAQFTQSRWICGIATTVVGGSITISSSSSSTSGIISSITSTISRRNRPKRTSSSSRRSHHHSAESPSIVNPPQAPAFPPLLPVLNPKGNSTIILPPPPNTLPSSLMADHDSSEYTHSPLNEEKHHIRLLTLLPGDSLKTGAPLRGSIRHVSLSEKPQYRALSYSWGKPKLHCPFLIDDARFLITNSLRAALEHIQHRTDPLTLWIDQICIKQNDQVEKSWQVRMMKEIYESAQEVLVWLGPEKDGGQLALRQLQEIGKVAMQENISEGPTAKLPANDYIRLMVDRKVELGDSSLNRLLARIHEFPIDKVAIIRLYNRPWWQRLWVIQEFVTSVQTTFIIGSERADADEVIAGVAVLHIARRGVTMWRQALDNKRLADAGLERIPKFESQAMVMAELRRMWSQNIRLTTDQLLVFCWRGCFRATDSRDYIFGLYGLAGGSDTNVDIQADYTQGIIQTYTQTTSALLAAGYHSILSEAQWRRFHWHAPSWVPDYAAGILSRGDTSAYQRSDTLSQSIRIEGKLAHFKGTRISKIARILKKIPSSKSCRIRDWIRTVAKPAAAVAYEIAPTNYGGLEAAEQAVYEAAVCAAYRVTSDKEYADDSMPTRDDIEEYLDVDYASAEAVRKVNWWADVAVYGIGRQLKQSVILTENGWFGMGYDVEPAGQIVMLDGFSKPVVLRKAGAGKWSFSRSCTICVPEGKQYTSRPGLKETFTVM